MPATASGPVHASSARVPIAVGRSATQDLQAEETPPRAKQPRIAGVDLARGLAFLGMVAAHTMLSGDVGWNPSTWSGVVNGRTAILFALLGGVSAALMTGGHVPIDGEQLVRARTRMLTRAVLIFAIGSVLAAMSNYIAIILCTYAAVLVMLLPLLRWSVRRLAVLAVVASVVTPVLWHLLRYALERWGGGQRGALVDLFLVDAYPALVWVTFGVVGLAVGRLDLTSIKVAARLLLIGVMLAVSGYAAGWGSSQLAAEGNAVGGQLLQGLPVLDWTALCGASAHSGTTFEIIGSTGVALAVLALCLMLPRIVRTLLYPIIAVGSMPLTLYALHVLVFEGASDEVRFSGFPFFWPQVVGALIIAVAWKHWRSQGPLEQLVAGVAHRASSVRSAPVVKTLGVGVGPNDHASPGRAMPFS